MLLSYLIYGLAFFLLWIVLIFYNTGLSKYSFLRKLWLIALFAITHGLHDLISVFIFLTRYEGAALGAFSLGLLVLSFFFLIQFGVSSGIFGKKYGFPRAIPLALLLLWGAATAASGQRLIAGAVFARYILGFPGALMAAWALFVRLGEKDERNPALNRDMSIAAWSFAGYAVLTGLIVPPADFFPASVLNYATFADKVGVPVHLFRAVCILAITYSLSELFQVFEANLRDSLQRSNEELEEKVRERTAELQRSNERYEAEIRERGQTEEMLRERDRQQMAILGNISDLAWLKDREGRFIAVNEAYAAASGWRPDELVGKTDLDIWPTELAEKYRVDDREVMELGRRKQVEETMVDSSGNTHWIETIKTPIYDDRDRLIGTTGIARDITERKKYKDALEQSEKRFRKLFENMQEGLLIQTVIEDDAGRPVDARYLDVNPASERFLGKGRAEIVGKTRNEVLGVPDPQIISALDRVAKTGAPCHLERYSEGAGKWFESFSYLLEAGQVATLVLDITERKGADEKIRESEAKYRDLFESSTDGIFIIGLDGQFIDVNRTASARLGYTKEEMLAMNIRALEQPQFAARAPERMRQILDHGFAVFESAHLRKDGTAMPVEVNSRLMEYGGRTVYFSVIRDITERKEAERALQEKTRLLGDLTRDLEDRVAKEIAVRIKNERVMVQQSKLAAMGEMLGAIAHQWRQPLNVVGLIVQHMEDTYARGKTHAGQMEKMADDAMKQIHRMSKTIDDFRNFFKPDKEKTSFDAMAAVRDVLALVSAQLKADNIAYRLTCLVHGKTFENEADSTFCEEENIEGFRNEFEHVILNLVNNARDAILERRTRGEMAASDKGLLAFAFSRDGGRIVIKVSDNGGGIGPEALQNIFDPYFTTKDPSKGTGMGLYMSKVIVEEHMKGTLTAGNAGEGAAFTIDLPQGGRGGDDGAGETV